HNLLAAFPACPYIHTLTHFPLHRLSLPDSLGGGARTARVTIRSNITRAWTEKVWEGLSPPREEDCAVAQVKLRKPGKVCPYCRSRAPALPRPASLERLLRLLLVRPHRCRNCGTRFWRFL